jgi:hypothetical protein
MRGIQVLGLTCAAAVSCAAAAAGVAGSRSASGTPGPRAVTVETSGGLSTSWRDHDELFPDQDRLAYLHRTVCVETRGCSTAASDQGTLSRRYVDALSLGSYGPMNVKFTGDRVKLRVRF